MEPRVLQYFVLIQQVGCCLIEWKLIVNQVNSRMKTGNTYMTYYDYNNMSR